MQLNNLTIYARLCADPELRYIPSGDAVTELRLANNPRKDKTLFINCTVFGKTAEACVNSLKKGDPVNASGHIYTDSWEKDGKKRDVIKMTAHSVQFLEGKKKEGYEEQTHGASRDLDGEVPF